MSAAGRAGASLLIISTTQSDAQINLKNVVWSYENFENNFGMDKKMTKYLKKSCSLSSDQHFSLKRIPKELLIQTDIAYIKSGTDQLEKCRLEL